MFSTILMLITDTVFSDQIDTKQFNLNFLENNCHNFSYKYWCIHPVTINLFFLLPNKANSCQRPIFLKEYNKRFPIKHAVVQIKISKY